MNYFLKLGFVLLLITAIASGILATINSFTSPIISENARLEKELARKEVLKSATTFDSIAVINEEPAFKAFDKEGNLVGYTFLAVQYGYSSDVKTMVGLNKDMTINKIKIIAQSETPGLGANSVKPEFQEKFNDLSVNQLKVDKDGGEVESITGATITTRTVTNSIKTGIESLSAIVTEREEVE